MEMSLKKFYYPSSCLLFLILFFSNPPSTSGTSIPDIIVNTGARMLNRARRAKQSKQFLHAHNIARASSHVPPLTWNKDLARFADKWAKQRKSDCNLTHSDGPYGENMLWHQRKRTWSPKRVVMSWFEERFYYDVETNTCVSGEMCGHYTQIVWRSTTAVGCARAKCYNRRGYIVVCEYDPRGNYEGERPY